MTSVPLDVIIRAVDRLTGPVRRISDRLNRLTAPARRVANSFRALSEAAGVPRLVEGFARVGTALGHVRNRVLGVARAFVGLLAGAGGLIFLFHRLGIGPAAQFERWQIMLTSIEGSAEKAERALSWVEEFAAKTPLQLTEVTDAFIQLRTFGLDPTDGTLQALVDQNAKMGGSADRLRGIILAVGQAWQKGKLQGEEALQLIERGVPVWDLLAKRVGKTTAEVQKASSAGLLGRNAIRALIEAIGRSSAGAAEQQMVSWDGMVSNMMDIWERFRRMIMDAGPFDFLKGQLRGILATVNAMAASGELQALAERIGGRITEGLRFLAEAARQLPAIFDRVAGAVGRFLDVIEPVANLLGGWPELIGTLAAVIVFGPLLAGLASLVAAFISLGAALIATPVGWFIGLIALLAAGAALLIAYWEPVSEFFDDLFGGVVENIAGLIDIIQGLGTLDLRRVIGGLNRFGSGAATFVNRLLGFGPSQAAGAPLGATAAAPTAQGGQTTNRLTIDIPNAPRGLRATLDPRNEAPVDLSVGYNMLEAYP